MEIVKQIKKIPKSLKPKKMEPSNSVRREKPEQRRKMKKRYMDKKNESIGGGIL